MTPLISIVLPTLNSAEYLAGAMAGCLGQTHPNLELIVVDGGSTDETLDIVARYMAADGRVRRLHQPANTGKLPGALNLGFAAARGDYFTWTQGDDYYEPDALAVLLAALTADPALGLAYTGFQFIDEAGQYLRDATLGPPGGLWRTNVVGHCFLYTRAAARRAGQYDPAYWMAEDFEYWLRLYRVSNLCYVPGRYYAHRLHAASLTMHNYGRYYALRVCARARRKVLGLSWPAYQRQVAAAYIEEAFAAFGDHAGRRARRCALQGLARDPAWLRNRGLLVLFARSCLWTRAHSQPGRY
ncbi:MAG: glycosyltransferase [Anaerolineales bacterium]|nr:glycosyltransferase [Anaerolineales bacterium]